MKLDRSISPEIRIPESVPVRVPSQKTAVNGMKLYAIEAGEQDLLRLSLVFCAGTRFQSRPYLASAVVNMLAEGTGKYSAREISEKTDFYGAWFEHSADRDYAIVSLCCLTKFLPEMLEVLEQMIVSPTFPERELDIYKNKRKHHLTIEREKVSFRARELFGEALFGKGHPYGAYYTPEEYDSLKSSHLQAFYKTFYRAGNGFAVCSGKASEEHLKAIVDFLGRIPGGGKTAFTELPAIKPVFQVKEERPDAVQSAIRVGKTLFPRTHPDFIGMQVLSTVLGGYFGSRLMTNLREERGYTYGVFSTMVNLESSGYLAVGTDVGSEFTKDAVRQIFHEIGRLRTETVEQAELALVKNTITGEFMRVLDGPFGIADVTIENIQNGTGNEHVARYLREVKEITPERLKALAVKYLSEDEFVTVIVGKG